MEAKRPTAPKIIRIILIGLLVVLYIPLVSMLISSFLKPAAGDTGEMLFTFDWYQQLFAQTELLEALSRSLGVAFCSSFGSVFIGCLASIALVRSRFRGHVFLQTLSMVSLMVPELVFALALLSWFVVLRLELSLMTVVIAHMTFSIPFVMMTVSARLHGLDHSIEDAARDLGATELQILFKITLPLLRPALMTGFLLAFLLSFDDFLITFFTVGPGLDTLPLKLYSQMKVGVTPQLHALSSLLLLATIGLIFVLSLAGGIKNALLGTKNA